MHLNSELLFKKYARRHIKAGDAVLEIGPTGIPSVYSRLTNKKVAAWDTIDLVGGTYIDADANQLTFVQKKDNRFPIKANAYDVVLAGQVLEHVREPWKWLAELKRVCKPGGRIILINPVSWPYHEAPVDCWRIYPEGMKALCAAHGLTVEMSVWESLEKDLLRDFPQTPVVPGEAIDHRQGMKAILAIAKWNKLLHRFPLTRQFMVPVQVSYDTVTICKK